MHGEWPEQHERDGDRDLLAVTHAPRRTWRPIAGRRSGVALLCARCAHDRRTPCSRHCGFSLVELIVVILVLGVLAVVVLPRLGRSSDFDALKFYEESLAAVRYAQKVAVAQNTQVFVVSSATSVSACFAADCSAAVSDPSRNAPLVVAATASGVGLQSPPAAFSFNGLGRPSAGPVTFIFFGSPARSFTVEAETGYVRP
jgi:MSHA pilin protein MshC